jgi:peptidoglycan L-alanyl-D-glutamate endopeptidase CwlK
MSNKFGKRSSIKLNTCHKDIQLVLRLAISRSKIDFGISEGHRDIETQRGYYAIGRTIELHRNTITNVDGIIKKGKHNKIPSEAVDIYVWHPDSNTRKKISYDGLHLSYVAGIIDSCAQELFAKGEIISQIRWGGNWDSDGVIKFDQNLNDMPHFEIK